MGSKRRRKSVRSADEPSRTFVVGEAGDGDGDDNGHH